MALFVYLSRRRSREPDSVSRSYICRIRDADSGPPWGARMLGQYVRGRRVRIVHSFDTPANIFGVFSAKFYDVPLCCPVSAPIEVSVCREERRLLRITDRLVDGIVVNNEALRRHLVEDEQVPPGHDSRLLQQRR